jgi:hypothetical protein
MGLRDSLREWVEPYDALAGWKVGDEAVTTREMSFSRVVVPAGSTVVISCVPSGRHGADPYQLSTFDWNGHQWLEVALSPETAKHHWGEDTPDVRRL